MSGHVETVTVSRCGDWLYGGEGGTGACPGNERGCRRCQQESHPTIPSMTWAEFDVEHNLGLEGEEREAWLKFPFPTEISHREFIQQYGRCPDGCRVAEQLELTG